MLTSPLLPHLRGYIAGRWVGSSAARTFVVMNPATGERLADVSDLGESEAVAAVEAGAAALRTSSPVDLRKSWLERICDLLRDNKPELARIITLEHGKPLKESTAEVDYAAGFFSYYARCLTHLKPQSRAEAIHNCRWTIHQRPAGVVGLIVPWNFPLAMLAKKLAPALAAGCSVVAKPAKLTPLASIAFWRLVEGIRIPPGVLNLVIGQAAPIGRVLCTHPDVRVISFTGSTDVGRGLIRDSAAHIKRLAMELGGNAPFIVFEDADVEAAADALMANKFRAGGQTCVCANRVYVHRAVAARFTEAVAARTRALKVGDGLDPATDVGPMINREGFDKVAAHVRDALAKGAARIVGNDPPSPSEDWGCFYPPTVLTGVRPDMLVCTEETFGPVVAIGSFDSEDEVLTLANDTPFGLAAYVFTRDAGRAARVVARLQFGHVGVNTGTGPTPELPFGGMKQSGFGREGGVEGLFEFCEPQTVACA